MTSRKYVKELTIRDEYYNKGFDKGVEWVVNLFKDTGIISADTLDATMKSWNFNLLVEEENKTLKEIEDVK